MRKLLLIVGLLTLAMGLLWIRSGHWHDQVVAIKLYD